jgi:hypothetical protein
VRPVWTGTRTRWTMYESYLRVNLSELGNFGDKIDRALTVKFLQQVFIGRVVTG